MIITDRLCCIPTIRWSLQMVHLWSSQQHTSPKVTTSYIPHRRKLSLRAIKRMPEGAEPTKGRTEIHTQICLTRTPSLTGCECTQHRFVHSTCPPFLSNLGNVQGGWRFLEDQTQGVSGRASPSPQGPNQWCWNWWNWEQRIDYFKWVLLWQYGVLKAWPSAPWTGPEYKVLNKPKKQSKAN